MNNQNSKPFAEVIESTISGWIAQSWQWNHFPAFGSLLAIQSGSRTLFGIVYHLQTGSAEPGRQPFAYQKTAEELMREQPHIFEFLKTTCSCVCVGYQEGQNLRYALAPEPPAIHSFIQEVSDEQFGHFFAQQDYLHLLFGFSGLTTPLEELLLAVLAQQHKRCVLGAEALHQFGQAYALLAGNDYRRMRLFMRRIERAGLLA